VLKTLIQITCFWTFFLLVIPLAIVFVTRQVGYPTFPPQPVLGWALFAAMGATGFYCGMLFAWRGHGTPLPLDTTTHFLVVGPYRYVRNPMALTGTMQGVAVGLILGNPFVILYAVSGMVLWHFTARPWEEADLERRFGDAYRRYRREIPLWVPRLRPYEVVDYCENERKNLVA
jgi:protein-S-isoprenylcysteine O-methyltransferase Ste14